MTSDSKPARRPIGEIWKAGLIGAGVAAIINIIAIIVLVLMAASPLGIPGAPASQIVIMEIMHLVAGISAIYFLTRWKP